MADQRAQAIGNGRIRSEFQLDGTLETWEIITEFIGHSGQPRRGPGRPGIHEIANLDAGLRRYGDISPSDLLCELPVQDTKLRAIA